MTGRVPVTKMHGTSNDFVVLDNRRARLADLPAFGRQVCDRHTAVGADGLIVVEDSAVADARMRVINADGSEAEMCGNGMRCLVRWLAENGEGERFRIETLGGIIEAAVLRREPSFEVRLGLGAPEATHRPVDGREAWSVVMGNPHVVVFVDDVDAVDLDALAARLQGTPEHPDGVNVHVAQRDGAGLVVRHWERGVGRTMACGTGAVSCAVAAIRAGMTASPVSVRVPGGLLGVEWTPEDGAFLTGPAVRVFDTDVRA